jgi:thiol:disulfide interchange protein DsbA
MKKMLLTSLLAALALTILIPALSLNAQINQPFSAILHPMRYDEGDNKIEIVYFFWYGCSHCYNSDQTTSLFLGSLPADVRVVKIPAIFEPQGDSALHGRLYFTLDELGVEKEFREKAFMAAQNLTDAGVPSGPFNGYGLVTKQAQESFAVANGISRADFDKAFESPTANSRFERARQYLETSGVEAVPTIVINGRYRLPYGPDFYKFAEQLINQERERLAAKTAQ